MKRKSLVPAVAVCLVSVLCYGCGNTAPVPETPAAEVIAEEAEGSEETVQAETEPQEEAETQETEDAAEAETETVYLISKCTRYDADGNITGTEEYSYDEDGRVISYMSSYGEIMTNWTYEYDLFDDGAIKKKIQLRDNATVYSETEYDAEGNEILFKIYNDTTNNPSSESQYTYENGIRKTETVTSYNEEGKKERVDNYIFVNEARFWILVDSVRYDDGSETDGSHTEYICEYNDAGLLVKKNAVDGSEVETYDYDSRGYMISGFTEEYDTDGAVTAKTTYTFDYDGQGNEVLYEYKSEFYDAGTVMGWSGQKVIYTYDEHNNVINTTGYNGNDTISSCIDTEYTYDSAFHITKSVETDENGNIVAETEYISMELPKTE